MYFFKNTLKQLLLFLCLLPPLANADKLVTAIAVAGHWRPSATAFALVSAHQQVILSLPFTARITALNVEPGANVAAGAELARFDAPMLRQHLSTWKQALLEVRLAQKHLQVLRESEAQHVITRQQLVAGEQAVAQAQGKSRMHWETLATDVDLLHIKTNRKTLEMQLKKEDVAAVAQSLESLKAPFSGIVIKRQVTLGEQVMATRPVFELEALQQVYLDVGVPETALTFWKTGKTRRLQTSMHMIPTTDILQPLGGAALYDASTGLWLLRFKSNNPGLILRDGSWVEVEHFGTPEPVVWVPVAAVVSRYRKAWCIVVHKHLYKAVEVQVGDTVDGRIPVLSGLSAGDRVVTKGAYELLYHDLKQLIKFVD